MKLIILIIFTIYLNAINENNRLYQKIKNNLEQINPLLEIQNIINQHKKQMNSMKKDIWETSKDFENKKIETKNKLIEKIKTIENQKFIFYSFGKANMVNYDADNSVMTLELKYNKDIKYKFHYLKEINNKYLKIINTEAKRLFKDKRVHDFFIEVKYNPKNYNMDIKKFYIKDGNKKLYINKKDVIPKENRNKSIDKYSLTIKLEPSNANIYIMEIKEKYKKGIKLPQGIYEIKITKNGYKTQQFKINLNKNIHKSIKLIKPKKKFKPKIVEKYINEYSLTIKTRPYNANIYIMKRKTKYKKGIKLPQGIYKIKVKKRGYRTKIFTINLNKNIHRYIKLIKYKRRRRRNIYQKSLYGEIVNYYKRVTR